MLKLLLVCISSRLLFYCTAFHLYPNHNTNNNMWFNCSKIEAKKAPKYSRIGFTIVNSIFSSSSYIYTRVDFIANAESSAYDTWVCSSLICEMARCAVVADFVVSTENCWHAFERYKLLQVFFIFFLFTFWVRPNLKMSILHLYVLMGVWCCLSSNQIFGMLNTMCADKSI